VGHQPGRQRVGFDGLCLEDILPAKESQACSINFCELTADLDCDLAIVLWLRFYRGLTVMEVAKQLRIPKGTVQSRTYAAIKKLREKARNGDF
jgi:RNA polymerase sigma factor (sigma-70 family)